VLLTLVMRFSLWLGSSVKSASNCVHTDTYMQSKRHSAAVNIVADSQCYITAAQKQHQTVYYVNARELQCVTMQRSTINESNERH
jgi:hypothetical protein